VGVAKEVERAAGEAAVAEVEVGVQQRLRRRFDGCPMANPI